ncbi:winged helix-turn-helix transcriptional regulator [Prevotella melaninogenica]|uniref:winged helix-turn-helix transcriptional regulator n=1 Tax=Prevotella melaninogenica TaxID=28132 RepID=UPI0009D6E5F5|nr:winged helix-turn-helix transcriptional regulator [Prevotella melaninogenica]ASE18079.1 transcriptional regulator [Prevotella melaninogenica]UEB09415.1 winged helix-turn-helix transcriptional regulator [Prevotella melaninogenica]
MVIDPLFPTCPIRNILSRICVADTLCLIQTLGKKGRATYEELRHDLPDSPLSTSLNILKEDRIIVESDKQYVLSNMGKELFPLVSTLIAWCERNVSPSLRQ